MIGTLAALAVTATMVTAAPATTGPRHVETGPVHCGPRICQQIRHITVYDPSPTITTQRRTRPAEIRSPRHVGPRCSPWTRWKTISVVTM